MADIKTLNKISFFDHFDEKALIAISKFFRLEEYATNEVILDQGGISTELLFLIEGSVNIIVDDEYVLTLSEIGEVFGEMSIVGHSTCTATVEANEVCLFLALDFQRLRVLEDKERERLEYFLYKSCAEILAKKLIQTNELVNTYKALIP